MNNNSETDSSDIVNLDYNEFDYNEYLALTNIPHKIDYF